MQENGNDYDLNFGMVNINGDPIVSPFGTHFDPSKGVLGGRNKSKNNADPDADRTKELLLMLKPDFRLR